MTGMHQGRLNRPLIKERKMSALCGIELVIESLMMLRKTLDDLKIRYALLEEMEKSEKTLFEIRTGEGKTELAEIIINDGSGTRTGFQKQADGRYRIISTASSREESRQQKKLAGRIKRRYAYNRIREELSKQGYLVVEEEKEGDETVRILARRWR